MGRNVLLTRPHQDCIDITQILKAKGYEVVCEPFIDVIYHNVDLPNLSPYAGLIATSAKALKMPDTAYDCAVYCVGTQTSEAAQALGFRDVHNGKGNVAALVEMIAQQPTDKPFLYLRARDISQDLQSLLPHHKIEEIITYNIDKIEKISDKIALNIIKGDIDSILFFSTRTAEAFMEWAQKYPDKDGIERGLKQTQALCLGESMIESLSNMEWKDIKIAARPTRESLLELL